MQAAGTTAKQINVIVCSHMRWQGARLFGEEKVSCPWEGEGGAGGCPRHVVPGYSHWVKCKPLLCFHTEQGSLSFNGEIRNRESLFNLTEGINSGL